MKPCTCSLRQTTCVNGTGTCMAEPSVVLGDIQKAKQVVLEKALGICALDEPELFKTLEEIYWRGFKAGIEKKGHAELP